jgi:aerobic-type carbon monoxide dehydrogenase small subunit (CoxS/CutS family)
MTSLTLLVNGTRRVVEVDPDIPLLWVLRETLDLTGTKYSCGQGLCGSCTVHLDGEATRSCVTTVEYASDKQITTIEGLAQAKNHPILQAWINEQVPQCGYCQPGQIMQAAVLLKNNGKPTDTQIDEWMADNLCRCGTYHRIRRAIHAAAKGGVK